MASDAGSDNLELGPPCDQSRTTRRKKSTPRRYSAAKLEDNFRRRNLRLLEDSLLPSHLVTLADFRLDQFVHQVLTQRINMQERKVQAGLPPLHLSANDGPRMVVDSTGNSVLFYAPLFWGRRTQLKVLKDLADLLVDSPLKDDNTTKKDRRVNAGSSHQGASTYWNLYHHGPGQQNVQRLHPSSTLTHHMGDTGIRARQKYLQERAIMDSKINDIIRLVHPQLYEALSLASSQLKGMGGDTGEWAKHWPSIFPSLAIITNRETKLHRDVLGTPYGADFLTVCGDFQGGALALPNLNLTLDWSPGAACLFDGRTFAHEVLPWGGSNRTCLVSYLWKTSIEKLSIPLPTRATTIEELQAIVHQERESRQARTHGMDQAIH